MTTRAKTAAAQFSLRSLMTCMMWLALVLAICVGYQKARARQREAVKTPHLWPMTKPGGQATSIPMRAGGEDW